MMEKIDDMRERLIAQMYGNLRFAEAILAEKGLTAKQKVECLTSPHHEVAILHEWWKKEGFDLEAELRRIVDRLEEVREQALRTANS